MSSSSINFRCVMVGFLIGIFSSVPALCSQTFSKIEVVDNQLIATEAASKKTTILFDDGVPKYACLLIDDQLIYSQMQEQKNAPANISLVVANLKSKKVSEIFLLYGRSDAHEEMLWQAHPPNAIRVFKLPFVLLAYEEDENAEKHIKYTKYAGIFNLEKGRLETVLEGNRISISRDQKNPMICADFCRFPRRGGENGVPKLIGPAISIWTPDLSLPNGLESFYPYLTSSIKVFPEFLGEPPKNIMDTLMSTPPKIQLLSSPLWAPSSNRLAFLFMEEKTQQLFASILDFTHPIGKFPFIRNDVDLPGNQQLLHKWIGQQEQMWRYYTDQPVRKAIDFSWKTDMELRLAVWDGSQFSLKVDQKMFLPVSTPGITLSFMSDDDPKKYALILGTTTRREMLGPQAADVYVKVIRLSVVSCG